MITINVYLQDGNVEQYDVTSGKKAREHAHRIINYGWRNVNSDGVMEYYPVHQILKVAFIDPKDVMSKKYKTKKE